MRIYSERCISINMTEMFVVRKNYISLVKLDNFRLYMADVIYVFLLLTKLEVPDVLRNVYPEKVVKTFQASVSTKDLSCGSDTKKFPLYLFLFVFNS